MRLPILSRRSPIARHIPVLAIVAAAFTILTAPQRAQAQPQTDVVTPTGWYYYYNTTLQTVVDRVNTGYRVVDIEIEDDDPFRISAVLVRDLGDYDKTWWWYVGLTEAQVNQLLSDNSARLIDVEPYDAGGALRFAVVMIRNSGADAGGWGWYYGLTFTGITNLLSNNPTYRLISIQPYTFAGVERYAVILLSNTGQNASAWGWLANTTSSTISNWLSNQNHRLIDLERHPNGNYSAITVPNDGNSWWWWLNASPSFIADFIDQYGARLIDLEYDGGQFWVIFRRNTNDLTNSVNLGMRNRTNGTSGFLLRELGGSTFAAIQSNKVYEPASTMKTTHHFHAMRQVALGNDNLANNVQVFQGLTGSCPNFTNPAFFSLQSTLKAMMEQSSNAHTAAIQDRYGIAAIEATAASVGANTIDINHRLGCLCGMTRNEITLEDLYDMHRAVDTGFVDPFRAEFYDFMVNSLTSNGMGGFNFQQALDQELAASILFPSAEAEFRAGVYAAAKGGSYTCLAAPEYHRSYAGYARLPILSSRCGGSIREYFVGAWVNDATTQTFAESATGYGYRELFRDRVRAAIDTWEMSPCHCPVDLTTTNTNPGQNGYGKPDGQLNGADLAYYVEQWFNATQYLCAPCADIADVTTTNTNPGQAGYGVPDGDVNGADLAYFVEQWVLGCS